MNKTLFIVLLSLYFSSCTSNNYDHYVLAFEFPGSVCQVKDCGNEFLGSLKPESINLHGLWPNHGDGEGPFECGPNIYNPDDVSPSVMSRMNDNFNGVYNSTYWFRFHEFGKHGSCFNYNSVSSERTFLQSQNKLDIFFTTALNALDQNGFKELFTAKDMSSGSTTYKLSEIEDMATKKYGKDSFRVFCMQHHEAVEKHFLTEFYICLDLNFKPMACPGIENHTSNCPIGKDLIFHTLNSVKSIN